MDLSSFRTECERWNGLLSFYYFVVCVFIPFCFTIVQVLILVGCSVLLLGSAVGVNVGGIGEGAETYDTQEGTHN